MKKFFLVFFACLCADIALAQFVNFDKNGKQIIRFSTSGNAIDAHDGEIAYFDGEYYLYGTSYDCGFEWGNKIAPFCGFKVYVSKDLKSWTDRGYLFDATGQQWQCRCNGKTYGCFRPHVVFNKKIKKYVLWVNVYDNRVGYRVFTASRPTGPFKEVAEPSLAVNNDMPEKGLNNGDHDLFIDEDGTAYLAYTDWRTNGTIVIEKLSSDYLTGTGECVKSVTSGATEAPALFKREGKYYILYSDPNCGYCGGTGTSYKTASSPLGPWSSAKKISDNSCGGQPSFVSVLRYNSKTMYVYGSDLWNNAAKNEALANYFWTPLSFDENGAIKAIDCSNRIMEKAGVLSDAKAGNYEASWANCDITNGIQHMQILEAPKSGKLKDISITVFKTGYPDADLVVGVYKVSSDNYPAGPPLYTEKLKADALGWSPKVFSLYPALTVKQGDRFCLVLKSGTSSGCYGAVYSEGSAPGKSGVYKSEEEGKTYTLEPGKHLKVSFSIKRGKK